MKELTLPNQIQMLVNNILDGLAPHEKPTKKIYPATGLPKARRDRPKRKDYFFYT